MYFKESIEVSQLFYNNYCSELVKLTFNVKFKLFRICYSDDSLRRTRNQNYRRLT